MSKEHLALIHTLPCCVCGVRPVEAHHITGGSTVARLGPRGRLKHSDFLCLPLCFTHHSAQGKYGIHKGVKSWEARHGKQTYFIDRIGQQLGLDLWALAKSEAEQKRAGRKAKTSSKILKRRFT